MKANSHQCPLCHQGELSQLSLMDVWGCSFCQHLFEWNLKQQTLKILDLSPPILWFWNGQFWQRGRQKALPPLTIGLVCGAIALSTLPAALLAIANFIFPPLPNSTLAWFPFVWQGLALISHAVCVAWVMAESYQFSPYLRFKVQLQQWLGT